MSTPRDSMNLQVLQRSREAPKGGDLFVLNVGFVRAAARPVVDRPGKENRCLPLRFDPAQCLGGGDDRNVLVSVEIE